MMMKTREKVSPKGNPVLIKASTKRLQTLMKIVKKIQTVIRIVIKKRIKIQTKKKTVDMREIRMIRTKIKARIRKK